MTSMIVDGNDADTGSDDPQVIAPVNGTAGRRSRTVTVLEWILAAGAALLALTALARLVKNANRGVDFTDEGMYLLSADAQSSEASFHNPFGRYTRVLYRLAGFDIARFRAIGEVSLALAAAGLGDRVAVASARLRHVRASVPVRVATAAALISAALHYYTLYLTTPSYNWLNLFGILVAAAGLIDALTRPADDDRWWVRWAGPATIAIGVACASMAKVSSGPTIFVVSIAASAAFAPGSLRTRRLVVARIFGAGAGLAVVHSVFINRPWVTVSQILRGQRTLEVLDPVHYELDNAFRSVRDAIEAVWNDLGHVASMGGWIALAAAVAGFAFPRRMRYVAAVFATVAVVLVALRLDDLNHWQGSGAGYYALTWVPITLLGVALLFLPMAIRSIPADRLQSGVRLGVCVIVLPVFGASYAFGSGNGFFAQLNGGFAPFVAAAFIILLGVVLPEGFPLPALVLAIVLGVGIHSVLDDAMLAPYRQLPVAAQTETVELGPGGGTLKVDPGTARFMRTFRAAAEEAGWEPGTPMLDFTPYAATALYVLEAKPPLTIIPTVGFYADTNTLAAWSLDKLVDEGWDDEFRDAWVITIDTGSPGAPDTAVLSKLGRTFPTDYEKIGVFEGIALYKPTTTG
ncbi:MAG: hypothetical protein SGJ13_00305 [Actinomycetota bacterium]|nr:hypothetical protein [Actinomycetota bacterium]